MFQTVLFEIFANLRPSKEPSLICSLHLFHLFLCCPFTLYPFSRWRRSRTRRRRNAICERSSKIKTTDAKQPLLHPSIHPPVNTISPMSEMTSQQQQCNATKYSLITQKKTLLKKLVLCRQALCNMYALLAGIVSALHSASSLHHQSLERQEQ